MTRVEKYREYRKEILNSFYNEKKNTTKEKSAELVSKATLNRDSNNSLSYDDVLEAYRIYDNDTLEEDNSRKKKNRLTRQYVIFLMGGIAVAILLVVALIVIGINLFGGR